MRQFFPMGKFKVCRGEMETLPVRKGHMSIESIGGLQCCDVTIGADCKAAEHQEA